MSSFSSKFMPAIGSSSRISCGSSALPRASSRRFGRAEGRGAAGARRDALAQAVRQRAGGGLAHRLQIEEVDDLLDLVAMLEFFAPRAGQPVQRPRDEIVLQQVMPPDHDVVEHAHMVKQREILEGTADAEPRPRVGIKGGNILAAIEQL